MAIAISDVGTGLYIKGAEEKYTKLVSITSAPATGSAPSIIEVTEPDSPVKQYISDRPDTPSYEFEANYLKETYENLQTKVSLTETKDYLIVYQDGSGEKFSATGGVWKKEVSAGNAVKIGIAFAVQTHEHISNTSTLIA